MHIHHANGYRNSHNESRCQRKKMPAINQLLARFQYAIKCHQRLKCTRRDGFDINSGAAIYVWCNSDNLRHSNQQLIQLQ